MLTSKAGKGYGEGEGERRKEWGAKGGYASLALGGIDATVLQERSLEERLFQIAGAAE